MPARTILVAAGTQPNTVLAREEPQHVEIDGKYFQAFDEDGRKVTPERVTKPSAAHVLMSVRPDGRAISFFGDLHPSFAGNVVKAMASAKQGYPVVSRALASVAAVGGVAGRVDCAPRRRTARRPCTRSPAHARPSSRSWCGRRRRRAPSGPGNSIGCRTTRRCRAVPTARRLGQGGPRAHRRLGRSERRDLLSTIVLEMGGSSDLCAQLEPGEPVVLMGPTGQPTETPAGETVLLIGGGLGNAVLFSIGQALRSERQPRDLFCRLQARDRPLQGRRDRAGRRTSSCGAATRRRVSAPNGSRTSAFVGNIVAALDAYGSGALGDRRRLRSARSTA